MGSELPLDEVRPLLTASAYPDAEGLTFLVGRQEVRLAGDLEFIGEVLALCDGRRTVGGIAAAVARGDATEVRELVEALRAEGVLVDCSEAWRTFHDQSSVGSGLFRPVSEEVLAEISGVRSRPVGELLRTVLLAPRPTRFAELSAGRRSAVADDTSRPPSFEDLSTVLEAMYARRTDGRRPVPSGGALYPLLLHVVLRAELPPLERGVWWNDPDAASIELLAADPPDTYDVFLPDNAAAELLAGDHPVVFISADVGRTARKYSNRAYRFALMEAGAAMQNAYLVCAELGLPIRAVAGFDERAAGRHLRLGEGCVPLLSLLLGT